ncbi:Bug family tripartite tricarboxylate transporter substrate binding protein [Pollutimonas sp. M17]|uniref:Bug family tripartite tricarboxylate transporter substrate binding protein n=1 Tax=Pollutimonas sp. M17 TaxID=2962065 RepID=UPI0021F4AC7F|nr:tripartite tricarboxylate transporter substrate binding protein [Pollutimonas sp. M17]UYO93167.1 tripartite tricarboxylate transporter substrate binding protein [Pollutimonas sp. M17]HWK72423.1 tripartite tricarboxylate transporter substrate binding protein [Burkholderiaceae bacterium]
MNTGRRSFVLGTGALMVGAAAGPWTRTAHAAGYPDKPVHVIIPYPPGAATDNLGRMAADVWSKELKQSFVVENKGGGGTMIGTRALATSAPDGYTLGMVDSAFVINPGLRGAEVPYDTLKDFKPIAQIATAPFVMVVHPSVQAKDLKSFIELAKASPGMLSYGSAGVGSGPHLAGEQLRQSAGIDIQHIPYRGGGTVITDLLGGQVQFAFATVPTLAGHIKAGRLRAIAVTTSQRVDLLPGVPTFAELGLPDVDLTPLFGLIAPAGVPDDIIQTLSGIIATSVRSGEMHQKLSKMGFIPVGSTPAEFQRRIQDEVQKWTQVIKRGGVVAQ